MKRLLVSLTTAAVVFITTSSQADLLLYEPFNYPPGEQLGGAGTDPIGKLAPNGQTWITRSPASGGTYDTNRDVQITAGGLSYYGLAPSIGSSVRYGTNAVPPAALYTDAISLPSPISRTDGSNVYWSAVVRFNYPNLYDGVRTCFASLSAESANTNTDAGYGLITSSGTANIQLPAGAFIRRNPTDPIYYQLGAGKQNGDGMGTSAGAPSWQGSGTGYPAANQQGNTTGADQDYAGISNRTYFLVFKYHFEPATDGSKDTVSFWVNPDKATLGYEAGEGLAGASGGSYFSATNAFVTAKIDAPQIQSFILLGNAQASAATNKTVDVTLDELRIGTTWADVTPAMPPEIISVGGAGTTSVTVTWTNVLVGTNYVLQYSTNLSTADWANLSPVTASGTTASQTDAPPSGAVARFYRVFRQ
jgi:hypothetical protein